MGEVRLQKFLAHSGVCSRRQAEQFIAEGRVTVNGRPAAFGDTISPNRDVVALDGERVILTERVYVLLNKPRGVLSAVQDPEGRRTVAPYLEGLAERVFSVGDLPMDTEGALLLTNDGSLFGEVSDPGVCIESTYIASVEGTVCEDTVARLRRGVWLEGRIPLRARAIVLDTGLRTTLLRIRLRERKNQGVSRMLDRVGHPVCELRRVALANLHIGSLEAGQWRRVDESDIRSFRLMLSG